MKKSDVNLITDWNSPREIFPSQYGNVSFETWCRNEKQRFARGGLEVQILRRLETVGTAEVPLMALAHV